MSAHTPGPWYVDNGTFVGAVRESHGAARPRIVAETHYRDTNRPSHFIPSDEARANAALIAAAPDLLAALRDLTSAEGLPDGYADRKALIAAARAAIAKVEGRS